MSSSTTPSAAGPLFSVVIATYNFGRYIAETLESVLGQSFADYEVIVIDDGSTDDTSEVIRPYRDRIRYHRQENRGVAVAWNAGIRASRGQVIGFLAADDRWEVGTLANVAVAFAEHPDVGVIALSARAMDDEGSLHDKVITKNTPGDFYSTISLLWGDSGAASFFFVRREVLDRVGTYDESLRSAEDCDLLLRLSFETRLMNLREPLIHHREHAASLSHDFRTNARCWIRVLDKLAAAQPDFVRRNRRVYRRSRGKELLRLGRETLSHGEPCPATWREARAHLAASIREFPYFGRAYLYLLWSVTLPSTFRGWRRRELARRIARGG